MKKSIVTAMAMTALLLSSCANDDLQNPAQDGAVVFTASLPQSFSRAIADGSNADTSHTPFMRVDQTTFSLPPKMPAILRLQHSRSSSRL